MSERARGLSTTSVHGGETNGPGPLDPPLVLSSAFGFASADEAEGAFRGENHAYIYGRWGNPNVELVERKVAALEGAEAAAAGASGMAVISGTVLACVKAGDHVVAARAIYGESARLLRERLVPFGVRTTFVDDTSPEGFRAAMTNETKLVYVETPANPNLRITDIRAVAKIAHEHGALCVADNTFATPYCQKPLALGADLVVHSMTKFLGGHGDAIGGCVAGSKANVDRIRDLMVKGLGGVLSPFSAFLVARGIRTFALRMAQSTATATRLAAFLAKHPKIERVHHPSLPSHPGHAIAKEQMRAFPAILAFDVKGGVAEGRKVLEGVRTIAHAVSLGDVRSLLTHPASTTASTMPREDRVRAGIGDGLLRLAVGIEDADDLEEDLVTALG